MVRARAFGWQIGCLVLLLAGSLRAESPSPTGLVSDMAAAYHSLTFKGRFIYMRGAEVSTLALKHAVIDGVEYERLSHLGGKPTEVIRAGNEAVCIHPDKSVTRLPASSSRAPFDLPRKLNTSVPEQYDVLLDGPGRVAGRDAWRLRLAPLDDYRYGYRLWVDRESRLLLKSELVDSRAVPLERMEFIALELGASLSPADFRLPENDANQSSLPPQDSDPGIRVRTGWLPGGFATAVRQNRHAVDGRETLTSETFSDGLAAFTVFVEKENGGINEGISRMGPTVALTRRKQTAGEHFVVTLVGEVPQQTAERVMTELSLREVAGD